MAVLPESEEMNSRCPLPRSTIAGASAWASAIGARRLTSSARSICSTLKLSSVPERGQRGVGHEDVHLARLGEQTVDLRGHR